VGVKPIQGADPGALPAATPTDPPFGSADLSNCERELIHLAGSVQPHGLLLVLDPTGRRVLQASANAALLMPHRLTSWPPLADQGLAQLWPELANQVATALPELQGDTTANLRIWDASAGATGASLPWDGVVHRGATGCVLVELEPPQHPGIEKVHHSKASLLTLVGAAVKRLSQAANLATLADAAVLCVRDLIGHDRVMVYKFDPDGHGKIIAEACDPRLQTLLGHRYPSTDIPQRARELYLRNRVRVLADVHYQASPLVPPRLPDGAELDMSMCGLRSMSPLHLQYLKNMGVTATLVVSLVREGKLWGLVAAHHYAPRNVSAAVRAACALLGEVISTRIAAIENYAHAQVAVMVRRLEQRLIEATAAEGDWRMALFRNPATLLQPLEASGAVLFVDGEVLTSGDVPSTPALRALLAWVVESSSDAVFSSASVGTANPELELLTPLASGVLAVRLSSTKPDYLMWLRKEQLHSVTWAGDPAKPMVANNPLELSPRSSFAAWSEIVRGTALPWTTTELALGRAIGMALVDIVVQVNAVRLLIAEHQLTHIRAAVQSSDEAVLIASAQATVLTTNAAFCALTGRTLEAHAPLSQALACFTQPERLLATLDALGSGQSPWRGEMTLALTDGQQHPVAVRAERVLARNGAVLGTIVTLFDLRDSKRAAAARRRLEASMHMVQVNASHQALRQAAGDGAPQTDVVLASILTNASLAAMDIADGAVGAPVARLLEELQGSTQRAAALYEQINGAEERS
jgi:two-component system, chemotaxis family, sensor kinase Cph1